MSVVSDFGRFLGPRVDRPGDFLSFGKIAILLCASAGSIAFVVGLFVMRGEKWGVLLNDPASQFDLPHYAGLFTYMSVMALVVAASVCLFACSLVSGRTAALFGLVGLLSTLLALDDLFLLHEGVLRHGLGLDERAIFAVYGAIGAAILWLIGPEVISRRYAGLWIAIGLLALMTLADVAEKIVGTPALLFLVEETAKLCGFVLWAGFWTAYAQAVLRKTPAKGGGAV